jgi:hypothetical protein
MPAVAPVDRPDDSVEAVAEALDAPEVAALAEDAMADAAAEDDAALEDVEKSMRSRC